MRQGDCCKLLWEDVRFSDDIIWVIPSKTEDSSEAKVRIPIFPLLLPLLEKARAERKPGDVYVFPDLEQMYRENPDGIGWRTAQLLKAAGVPVTLEKHKTGKRRVNRSGFSALRTTFITMGLSLGIKEELLRKVTGHAAMEIVRTWYFMPDSTDIKEEMKKFGAMFGFKAGSTA
jgi:integrase